MVYDSQGTIKIWLYCVCFVFVVCKPTISLNILQTMWLERNSVCVSKPWLLPTNNILSILTSTSWLHWFKKIAIAWLLSICGVVFNKLSRKLLSNHVDSSHLIIAFTWNIMLMTSFSQCDMYSSLQCQFQ